MLKRSFFCVSKPRFEYESIEQSPMKVEKIPIPKTVTLFLKKPYERKDATTIKIGDKVKTGQKIKLYPDSDAYVISSVTGTVSSLSPYLGDFGQSFTAIGIDVAEKEEWDDAFSQVCNEITGDTLTQFLAFAPGAPDFKKLFNPEKPIHTIVISGMDSDLMVATNQFVMKSQIDDINVGISLLKKLVHADHVVVALPQDLMRAAGSIGGAAGVELRVVNSEYPSGMTSFIMRNVLGKNIPAGTALEDMGICFFNAEAVASVGNAVKTSKIPVTKIVTLIRKDLSKVMVQARIGTPICDIFNICGVTLKDMDRIVIGGPMTGAAVYLETHPIQPDTNAIMVQDGDHLAMVSDYPCINCGECVRICPMKIPVNMLVRYLEAKQYQAAADQYDLYSCIECGLCSYVCVAKMPIFQYIRLAKYELELIKAAEATHE